jgi:septation ring formation regulator EzrA
MILREKKKKIFDPCHLLQLKPWKQLHLNGQPVEIFDSTRENYPGSFQDLLLVKALG